MLSNKMNASANVHGDKFEIYSFCTSDVYIIADFAVGNILRHDVGCKCMGVTGHSITFYILAYHTGMELYVCLYVCMYIRSSGGRNSGGCVSGGHTSGGWYWKFYTCTLNGCNQYLITVLLPVRSKWLNPDYTLTSFFHQTRYLSKQVYIELTSYIITATGYIS